MNTLSQIHLDTFHLQLYHQTVYIFLVTYKYEIVYLSKKLCTQLINALDLNSIKI
jgi:hypothetical protein